MDPRLYLSFVAALLLSGLLSACGESSPAAQSGGTSTGQLCVSSDCGRARQIVDLPDLENLLVTAEGRVFVTGQQNFYEILKDSDASFRAVPFFEGASGCSGMALRDSLIYVLCQGPGGATDFSGLSVLDLSVAGALPEPIYSITGMSLPNGLVVGPDHSLYVTDGPIAAEPKIVRVALDPLNPRRVTGQQTWLLTQPDYPNGLAILGNSLYTTLYSPGAGGSVARIDIQPDGSPGPVVVLHPRGIMDDLKVHESTLLVTDWEAGRIFQITLDGLLLQQTAAASFSQPSSVDVAGPPLFAHPTLLITERYSGRGLWVLDSE